VPGAVLVSVVGWMLIDMFGLAILLLALRRDRLVRPSRPRLGRVQPATRTRSASA